MLKSKNWLVEAKKELGREGRLGSVLTALVKKIREVLKWTNLSLAE